jgi:prophage antirepressor-like protein
MQAQALTLPTPTLINATFPQAKAAVTVIRFGERSFWIARQVGKALGYEDEGRKFPQAIIGKWARSGKLRPEVHYMLLEGETLIAFRSAVEAAENTDEGPAVGPSSLIGRKASSLLLLTEAGLYASILLSDSSVSIALMDWLTLEVLPMIRRTGMYAEPEHPLRRLLERLGDCGYFAATPEEDPQTAFLTDMLKSETSKGLSTIWKAVARFSEARLQLNLKRGLIQKPADSKENVNGN